MTENESSDKIYRLIHVAKVETSSSVIQKGIDRKGTNILPFVNSEEMKESSILDISDALSHQRR